MDQNDQRDYAEEAANRQIDRDEVVDFADFEYQVDSDEVDEQGTVGSIDQITDREMELLLNRADQVHFVDGDDAVRTVRSSRSIAVVVEHGRERFIYSINIDYIRELLNKINQINQI